MKQTLITKWNNKYRVLEYWTGELLGEFTRLVDALAWVRVQGYEYIIDTD